MNRLGNCQNNRMKLVQATKCIGYNSIKMQIVWRYAAGILCLYCIIIQRYEMKYPV